MPENAPEIPEPDTNRLLAPPPPIRELALPTLPADDPLYETSRHANEYVKAAKAPATRKAYHSDWQHFVHWCDLNTLCPLPAEISTVAFYLTALAHPAEEEKPRKAATIARRLTSINIAHKTAGLDSPATMNHRLVADTLAGIRRTLGTKQAAKKPLTLARIVKLLAVLEGPLTAPRDKVLLLLGFAGSLRRSEMANLRFEDLHWHRKGITLTLPKSKTDQEGKGREVEILQGVHDETCPVLALQDWMKIAGVQDGYILRRVDRHGDVGESLSKGAIATIIKKLVKRAKLADPLAYGGHSLRAGFVTEASGNGASDRQIMKQTGHKSVAMVHRYTRADQQDRQAAASKLGL